MELREQMENTGAIFHTSIDSEIIAYGIARERVHSKTVEEAILRTVKEIRGAYALVIMSPRKLIGVRDPYGLKPLCIGKRDNAGFSPQKAAPSLRSAPNSSAMSLREKL